MSEVITMVVAVGLLFLSGAFSGLNIGLMMARPDDLKRKAAQLKRAGHSRVPVRSDGELVGLLYLKDLVGQELPLPVSQAYRDKIHDIDARSHLDTVLSRFIQTRSHLFVVLDGEREVGIVTLEDVIEEIIRREIEDEFDVDVV